VIKPARTSRKERYAVKEDTSIVQFRQPGSAEDPLTEIAREGARRMLATALEAEIGAFVGQFAEERLPAGRQRVVRHGYGPERKIQTGIGALEVRRPKVRDRAADVESGEKVRFTSHILPKWARRSRSLDALLPVLYLRGISTGDFQEALSAILGAEAPNLSPGVISRLTVEWEREYEHWKRRDLSARRYVYIWADGVYLQARMEPEAECILVVIGATPEGKKELVGFHVGKRESAQSWRELLIDLEARGLAVAPEIAVGDGALGFWKALDEVFPGARHQRCWVHKVANVLNKFPKSMAPTVKSDLRDIWQAETRAVAEAAMDTFAAKYGAKYNNAVACLVKDREALLTFFAFPAEHWDHLRTANPIESVFATVRHRTIRTKGALSQKTAKLMVFALVRAASRKWRRLKGANQLPLVVNGIKFTDGVAVGDAETRAA
jgi:putative transposase